MKHLKLLAKILIGFGFLVYAVRSKMIDFDRVVDAITHPGNLLICFAFLSVSLVLCSIRWHSLIKSQGLSLSFREIFELTMIGNFFNTFMPGSVGGDVVKGWYVAGRESKNKTKAVVTVLVDRVIGLSVMLLYSAVTCLFYQGWLTGQLKTLALGLWAFTSFTFLGGFLFFSKNKTLNLKNLISKLPIPQKLHKLRDTTFSYQSHFSTVVFALCLSALSILNINLYFYFQGGTIGLTTPLSQYFFVIPVCLTVSALPFLPGGIGVGQIAFFTLFKWIGEPNPELGSTLCTIAQFYTILFNCLGAVFYFKYQPKLKQVV